MKIRSTTLDLTTEPFLLVLFKHLLCSRFGQFNTTLATKHGKNELKLFLRGFFYFQNFIATITKAIKAKTPITFTGTGILEKVEAALLPLLLICVGVVSATLITFEAGIGIFCPLGATKIICIDCELSSQLPPVEFITSPTEKEIVSVLTQGFITPVLPAYSAQYEIENGCVKRYFPAIGKFILMKFWLGKYTDYFFTFYSFEKTAVRWQKSFNSFLLPLKVIRSGKVAMEHNAPADCRSLAFRSRIFKP